MRLSLILSLRHIPITDSLEFCLLTRFPLGEHLDQRKLIELGLLPLICKLFFDYDCLMSNTPLSMLYYYTPFHATGLFLKTENQFSGGIENEQWHEMS